jgi:hypothetical protein
MDRTRIANLWPSMAIRIHNAGRIRPLLPSPSPGLPRTDAPRCHPRNGSNHKRTQTGLNRTPELHNETKEREMIMETLDLTTLTTYSQTLMVNGHEIQIPDAHAPLPEPPDWLPPTITAGPGSIITVSWMTVDDFPYDLDDLTDINRDILQHDRDATTLAIWNSQAECDQMCQNIMQIDPSAIVFAHQVQKYEHGGMSYSLANGSQGWDTTPNAGWIAAPDRETAKQALREYTAWRSGDIYDRTTITLNSDTYEIIDITVEGGIIDPS